MSFCLGYICKGYRFFISRDKNNEKTWNIQVLCDYGIKNCVNKSNAIVLLSNHYNAIIIIINISITNHYNNNKLEANTKFWLYMDKKDFNVAKLIFI